MSVVSTGARKKDAMGLVTGKPVYTGDMVPMGALRIKLLRSPHARANIRKIDASRALRIPGVVGVFTYKDMPERRFTTAGQTWPEPSPYDRRILDRHLRCVGDPVAIVAAETEAAALRAMRLIKVEYEVLPPLLDFKAALDNPILVHPEEDFHSLVPFFGTDAKRNLVSTEGFEHGDVEAELAKCDVVLERTYNTVANSQAMMEPFCTSTYLDEYGRLTVIGSTQVPFHVRRILSNALEIPKSEIRVIKPRIGGGFGAKQSVVSELFPAIVTKLTGRPAFISYTRQETFTNGSPRHQMQMKVRIGADKGGTIRAIDLYALSNAGAYGDHGPTTIGLVGHKALALYDLAACRFGCDVVYTNTMGAGAYRGYGATQGIFAVESAVNELAAELGMDPCVLREKNMVHQGQVMPAYYDETCTSCTLDACMDKAREMMGWDEGPQSWTLPNGHIRGRGVAMAMQGSGISAIDTASAEIRLNDGGFYTLLLGCSDMGTGCDTILAQMAADCLDCGLDDISVRGVDTDQSPYDCGSYASSTTYVTGTAVVKACAELREKICTAGAKILDVDPAAVEFDGERVFVPGTDLAVSRAKIGWASCDGHSQLSGFQSHCSPVSPPPFMVGMAEVDVDPETGIVTVVDYAAAVDCGTVINTNLARVQTEGGIVQGIGMALLEQVRHNGAGKLLNDSLLQYKIPTRQDAGAIRVDFVPSYEPSGPFGAKSIGELVINTPAPAIAEAIRAATGYMFRTLPILPEDVAMAYARDRRDWPVPSPLPRG